MARPKGSNVLLPEEAKRRRDLRSFQWKKEHKEAISQYIRKVSRQPKGRYQSLISTAKARGLEVTLSFENYKKLIILSCYYCGEVLSETGSGIDRIDSNIGYVEGNCRPCCKYCNRSKSNKTEAEFKEWVLRIYNNWINK